VGQLDLVVRKGLLLREEDEPEARLVASRRLDRDRQKGHQAGLLDERAPVVAEAIVRRHPRRGEDTAALRCVEQRRRPVQTLPQELRESLRKLVRAGEAKLTRLGHQHGGERAAQRPLAAWATASSVSVSDSGCARTEAIRKKPR
jgi:hypothetical protein